MNDQKTERKFFIWISILMLIIVSLACNVNNIDPEDVRLQAPITTTGKTFDDFLKQLNMIPKGGLMAPWITEPATAIFQAEPIIGVAGTGALLWNREIVIYEVIPNEDLTAVDAIKNRLDTNVVIENNYLSWRVAVTLPSDRQYLAARIEDSNNIQSPFSNIIYISRGDPAPLEIISPENLLSVTPNINLEGLGEPKIGLSLLINGEKTPYKTVVLEDGSWTIKDVPLTIAGFDNKNSSVDANQNTLTVKAEATGQSVEIVVRRQEPFSLIWPFRNGEGDLTWNPALSKVTSFAYDDWHRYDLYKGKKPLNTPIHPALDIISANRPQDIYAVADGTVTAVETSGEGAWYIIVDAGYWSYMYLHIAESYVKEKDKVTVIGKPIAKEGKSGTTKVHLHIEVCVKLSDVDEVNSDTVFRNQIPINLNPPKKYEEYFLAKGLNLYDWWGGSDYCAEEGCWKDVDWTRVGLVPDTDTPQYEQACWKDDRNWSLGKYWIQFSSRAYYCELNPDECPCLK